MQFQYVKSIKISNAINQRNKRKNNCHIPYLVQSKLFVKTGIKGKYISPTYMNFIPI